MNPTSSELIEALPEDEADHTTADDQLRDLLAKLADKPVPIGRLTRLWTFGTLQAKLAAAYLAWWVRTFHSPPDAKQQALNETHLKSAIALLGSMSYLRGAIMKVGQLLANYPEVVPQEFAEVLGRLHFQAPPMHFSLLREFVRNELGDDPENIFDDFEPEAFAAASLGQVHRARLKQSGQCVAIKIQYPNIARTIRDDLRNMKAIIAPMRLGSDWDNIELQFDDIRRMLDLETDYEQEAEHMRIARLAFTAADEVVVPKVFPEFCTKRILTMEYLQGRHLNEFLQTNPAQELRDQHGRQIVLAMFRLSYGSHLLYADPHPGNFFFMEDGRLGLIDFGCCHRYTDADLDYVTAMEQAIYGSRDDLRLAVIRATDMTTKQQADEPRVQLLERWCDWVSEPLLHDGSFDFGDPAYFRRGVELYGEALKRRYVRSLPVNTWLTKNFFGLRAILSQLKARVDLKALTAQETTVARPTAG